jgi:RNA polymerase sigma-70 factor (ECF subfamily)
VLDCAPFPWSRLLAISVHEDAEDLDYAALRRDLARAVARLCPTWLAGSREDLVQAAIMRVMRIAGQPPPGEGTRPLSASYLYRIAYSVLVDELRRRTRRRETDLDGAAADLPPAATADPERETASREIARGIRACLQAMVRDRRLAVTLHLQGHSVGDAARILDWAQKRTENLVYRGLADLRACLAAKGLRP